MTRTLLTGATGRLGQELRPRLDDAGHEVRLASRSPPDEPGWCELDLANGTGVREAVSDVEVVIHAASAPQGDAEAVDVRGTERLLDAAADAGVKNFVYVSIVGIEDVPLSYYQHKLTAERAVEASGVPSTIFRATQFHQFVHELLAGLARLPVRPIPRNWRIQPVDVAEVADRIVEHATTDPGGRLPDVGGPEVHTAGELARTYRDATNRWRPVVGVPVPGSTSRAFRSGAATCPDRAVGTVTWEEFLAGEAGATGVADSPEHTGTTR